LLDRFLELGVRPGVASDLAELGSYPAQNKAVILTKGTLARLLEHGIGPVEAWTFLLNHGAARQRSGAVVDPRTSDIMGVTEYDAWARVAETRKLLDDAIQRCSQAAAVLQKLSSVDVAKALVALGRVQLVKLGSLFDPPSRGAAPEAGGAGPHPALAPERTSALIAELEWVTGELKKYRPLFEQAAKRPVDDHSSGFCRDWYALATERAGNPLYAEGAALYSLVISATKPNSFKVLCKRTRKGT
jgi:hypothetical protein